MSAIRPVAHFQYNRCSLRADQKGLTTHIWNAESREGATRLLLLSHRLTFPTSPFPPPHLFHREQRLQQPGRKQREADEGHSAEPARGLSVLCPHVALMEAQCLSQGPQHHQQPLLLQTFKQKQEHGQCGGQ